MDALTAERRICRQRDGRLRTRDPGQEMIAIVVRRSPTRREFLREAKKLPPDAALIAMSGGGEYMAREFSLNLATSLGVSAMLKKPLRLEALINAVETALGIE